MAPIINLKGKVFGGLTVLQISETRKYGHLSWDCKCKCGNVKPVAGFLLRNGEVQSCGCGAGTKRIKHGHGGRGSGRSATYQSYHAMLQRCYYADHVRYNLYGGRGIRVCRRWKGKNGFENFLADMGPRPNGLTIDRINANGNYTPKNCRWATPKTQVNNRTISDGLFRYRGQDYTIAELAKLAGFSYKGMRRRILSGMTVKKSVETPKTGRWS